MDKDSFPRKDGLNDFVGNTNMKKKTLIIRHLLPTNVADPGTVDPMDVGLDNFV